MSTTATVPGPRRAGGFSLLELMVTVAVIATLTGLLLPSLSQARSTARGVACLSNLRQLGLAWQAYAHDHRDMAMPLALGPGGAGDADGTQTFWWGRFSFGPDPVDHRAGILAPYLDASLAPGSVYECPSQGWGTYDPQPMAVDNPQPTSTYGYNGYFLSPAQTPGWSTLIGHRKWQRISDLWMPTSLFVFADAMMPTNPLRNSALLDPPFLYIGNSSWQFNESPTTAFRHGGRRSMAAGLSQALGNTHVATGDGGARAFSGTNVDPTWRAHGTWIASLVAPGTLPGPVANAPHYVPDALSW